MRMPELI
ncbi:hypothetical protein F383_38588 [Gossypium arboreum]|nr:hypothetical protein F383_38588 [Gossypium arboreum]